MTTWTAVTLAHVGARLDHDADALLVTIVGSMYERRPSWSR